MLTLIYFHHKTTPDTAHTTPHRDRLLDPSPERLYYQSPELALYASLMGLRLHICRYVAGTNEEDYASVAELKQFWQSIESHADKFTELASLEKNALYCSPKVAALLPSTLSRREKIINQFVDLVSGHRAIHNSSWYARVRQLPEDSGEWLAWVRSLRTLFVLVQNMASALNAQTKIKVGKQAAEFDRQLYALYTSVEVMSAFAGLPSALQPTRLQAVNVLDIVQRWYKNQYKQGKSVASALPQLDPDSDAFRREILNFPGWALRSFLRVMERKKQSSTTQNIVKIAHLTVEKLKKLGRKKADFPKYGFKGR